MDHKIENDGTVKFRENQYTSFKYYIDNTNLERKLLLVYLEMEKN